MITITFLIFFRNYHNPNLMQNPFIQPQILSSMPFSFIPEDKFKKKEVKGKMKKEVTFSVD